MMMTMMMMIIMMLKVRMMMTEKTLNSWLYLKTSTYRKSVTKWIFNYSWTSIIQTGVIKSLDNQKCEY